MNLLFICHRPYHVLRSAQFVDQIKSRFKGVRTTLVTFDVYDFSGGKLGSSTQKYNSFGHLFNYPVLFDQVIELERANEKRIWDLDHFLRYYRLEVKRFNALLDEIAPADNVFFFSDKEKPVEILVSLSKERWGSTVFLVDEGIVSYSSPGKPLVRLVKYIIVKLFGLKHISPSFLYGRSGLYDYSVSTLPELSFLKGRRKLRLPSLVSKSSQGLLKTGLRLPKGAYVLYVSSALQQSMNFPVERELAFLSRLAAILQEINLKLVIKPHPVEARGKFNSIPGVDVIEEQLFPVELLFDRQVTILSAISSTLINAKNAGVRAATVAALMGIDHKDVDQVVLIHEVYCPGNFDDLVSFIRSNDHAESDMKADEFQDAFFLSLKCQREGL
ncbi:MAG: alpha-2,8-polysialyltransferase family protein [Bacteroidetes bacterium]|nr:alpha-2,8-polysialyltransferase family protein [Bacteroidota bacterium]